MRVCVLSVVEPKHMVMVSMYTDYFIRNNIPYDFVFLDRYHEEYELPVGTAYRLEIDGSKSLNKIIGYLRFRKYAEKIIKKNKYNFIVVWNEYTAVLFSRYLCSECEGKYSINVRDLFDPNYKIRKPERMYPLLNKSIESSSFTTVSSAKYIDYLVKFEKYLFIHSVNSMILPEPLEHKKKKTLTIMYLGKIGYLEEVKKLLCELKNDDRFLLKFIGVGSDKVQSIAEEIGCKNIEIVGMFDSKETVSYLQQADIIFNLYGDSKPCEQTALSNKLYYAVCLNIPILVYKKTYMYEVASSCGIGFAVDAVIPGLLGNKLYQWYNELDFHDIHNKCEKFKKEAISSHRLLDEKLDEVLHAL